MNYIEGCLTQWQAEHTFQMFPAPPAPEQWNDLIVKAKQEETMEFFLQFLHFYEPKLNKAVRKFLTNEGFFGYDPDRFFEYKMACVEALLEQFEIYDPTQDAAFLTFSHHALRDSLLTLRMIQESGSYNSLAEYKRVRRAAHHLGQSGEKRKAAARTFAEEEKCGIGTAEEFVNLANTNRSIASLYQSFADEEGDEESQEIAYADPDWTDFDILWNAGQETAMQEAFWKLPYKEQVMLEQKLGICMKCGAVQPWAGQDDNRRLAQKFEKRSEATAIRAYNHALENLAEAMLLRNQVHTVELRKTKKAAAVYEYRADCDGAWGEIQFDSKSREAEILKLADGDFVKTQIFAKEAIRYLRKQEKLGKQYFFVFEFLEPERTLGNVIRELVEGGSCHAVVAKLKFRPSKGTKTLVYEYCADFDDCWGTFEIDIKKRTARIRKLAEGDAVKTHAYANAAISQILTADENAIPRNLTIPFLR